MKKFPVVLDLETKHTFREFDEHKKLGVTVMAIYDYATNQGQVFTEKELSRSFPILEKASYLVGYNIAGFDLPVLQPYYPGDVTKFPVFDILEDIRLKIGRRIGLNDVASATLNKTKTGHGLMAVDYYREGKWEELKKYCMDDVMVTKELFDYGVKYKEIEYKTAVGRTRIKVNWSPYMDEAGSSESHLTLPF